MSTKQSDSTWNLRQRAEKNIEATGATTSETLTHSEALRLLHELQVTQIELEMKNEELKLTKHDLEAARDSYFDLYDFAPVGYLTLNKDALIQRINLTAATMHGLAK